MTDLEIDQRKIDAIFGHTKQGMDKYYLQSDPESLIEPIEHYARLDSQVQLRLEEIELSNR